MIGLRNDLSCWESVFTPPVSLCGECGRTPAKRLKKRLDTISWISILGETGFEIAIGVSP